MRLVIQADWIGPSLARAGVRDWLHELDWPDQRIEEMTLAVSEVISNSIEHGYGLAVNNPENIEPSAEVVEIDGRILAAGHGYSQAVITVSDYGRWRAPQPGPSTRGRGMQLVRACMDHVITEHRTDGTTIILRSLPV